MGVKKVFLRKDPRKKQNCGTREGEQFQTYQYAKKTVLGKKLKSRCNKGEVKYSLCLVY